MTSGTSARTTTHSERVDERWMRRAVELAERGWGRVSPNPLVGAILVKGGRAVGEGWHAEFGEEHAEIAALRDAGGGAADATLYVTLEPCAHRGKTPPCTDALVQASVRRVVVACRDPNGVAAGGVEALREAGVEVETDVEAEAAARLNAAFLWSHTHDTPFTTLKLALSLDARIAARPGERSTLTAERAVAAVHRLRAGHDALLVGRRTATTDDPLLTARGEPSPRRPPLRVVLDPDLRLDPEAALLRTLDAAPVLLLCAPDAEETRRRRLEALGARVAAVPRAAAADDVASEGGRLDLAGAWRRLREEGVRSLLVEGGGRVASSVLRGELAQRLHFLYAPLLFGSEGVEAFPDAPAAPRGRWRVVERRALDEDTAMVLEPQGLARRLAAGGASEDGGEGR